MGKVTKRRTKRGRKKGRLGNKGNRSQKVADESKRTTTDETKIEEQSGEMDNFLSDSDDEVLADTNTKDAKEDARARLKARIASMRSKRRVTNVSVDEGGMAGSFGSKAQQRQMQKIMDDVAKYGDEAYKTYGLDENQIKSMLKNNPDARKQVAKALK